MSLKNTQSTYGSVAKFFHWSMAFLIIALLIYGALMLEIPKDMKGPYYNLHKLGGLTVLGLVMFRSLWALMNPKPALPSDVNRVQQWVTRAGHVALYGFMFFMPLSGWIMTSLGKHHPFFFQWDLALPFTHHNQPLAQTYANLHYWGAWLITVLILGHLLAAVWHHYVHKDNTLIRMMPDSKGRS